MESILTGSGPKITITISTLVRVGSFSAVLYPQTLGLVLFLTQNT